MGATAWALPVGILAGICGIMFIGVWYFFPKYYKRGIKMDMDRVDEERRQRELHAQQNGDVELGEGVEGTAAPPKKPTTFQYTPPAYTAY